ncbi:DnaD domain protein [Clostridium tarantellae]|uniref:Replication initiator A N-terminal domain-containing protein n=1 Tax=Clostridium tarantellae TaxID=39493 RepID=A0A6I1MK36_9CLOT|nr:DnaD domain protein [Clostridium tarantellae]MPQ43755.1 hypothetical protein [Clostridium tarantellae]
MKVNLEELKKLGCEFYKNQEANESKFISIPKQLYICPFYKNYLSPVTRELYAWLKDRMSLSESTSKKGDKRFVDENGYIFLIYTRENLMKILNVSKQTIADSFKILNALGLIFEKKMGQGKPNRIYIGKVLYMSEHDALERLEYYNKHEILTKNTNKKSSNFQKSKNSTSKSKKIRLLEVENLDAINTNTNKTESSKTNTSSSSTKSKREILTNIYEEAFKPLSNYIKNKINTYIEKTNIDFVIEILKYSIEHNAKTPSYFFKTLDNLIENNINTVEALEVSITKFNKKIEKKKKTSSRFSASSNEKKLNFTNYSQREYDYDELEKQLLENSGQCDRIITTDPLEKYLKQKEEAEENNYIF